MGPGTRYCDLKIMAESIQIFLIIFTAVFTQSFLGFGSAIVAMGLLPAVLGLPLATPLFAIVALLFEPVLVFYYRRRLEFRAIRRLLVSSLAGVPAGIYLLNRLPERLMLTFLGAVILGYGLYALSNLKIPEFRQNGWAYFFGFLSGAFGGAYAVSGPPVIIYGHGKRWDPAAFKGNLQAFFIVTSLAIVAAHAVNGSFVPAIWPFVLISMPAAALGLVAGLWLDRFVRPEVFRKVVLAGIIVSGIGLVF